LPNRSFLIKAVPCDKSKSKWSQIKMVVTILIRDR
jgi:hypothetical protein